ncbi:MAG: hypothetical protein QM528_06620 [Phycisphaerales bacterium]|nr:hypothetical protein [Phycisphaerales bacterium]
MRTTTVKQLFFCLIISLVACKKNTTITPSLTNEFSYSINGGASSTYRLDSGFLITSVDPMYIELGSQSIASNGDTIIALYSISLPSGYNTIPLSGSYLLFNDNLNLVVGVYNKRTQVPTFLFQLPTATIATQNGRMDISSKINGNDTIYSISTQFNSGDTIVKSQFTGKIPNLSN